MRVPLSCRGSLLKNGCWSVRQGRLFQSRRKRCDFARAVVFYEFSHHKIAFAGGVFSLFAGEFNALIDLDDRRIAEKIIDLVVAFVLEGYRRRHGDGAACD